MANPSMASGLLWRAQSDLDLNRELIAASRLFDYDWYVTKAGASAARDPIGHYLLTGWRQGLEPNAWFTGTLFQPYYLSAGFSAPPLVTWLIQHSAKWTLPACWDEAREHAHGVRASGLFDETFYKQQTGSATDGLDLAIHYVLVGERLRYRPSAAFDPGFYFDSYPDIARSGMNALLHFHAAGRTESRRGLVEAAFKTGGVTEDPAKANIIVVVHDTSRTGAPVLGWNLVREFGKRYNVFTIRMGNGELTEHFEAASVEVHGPFLPGADRQFAYLHRALSKLLDKRKFEFAVVNSVESRYAMEPLNFRFIATLLLMHEFAFFVQPQSELAPMFDWSSEIVFPAPLVAQSARDRCPSLLGRQVRLLPQGASALPEGKVALPERKAEESGDPGSVIEKLTQMHERENAFIVISAGWVQIRKGVDLFLNAAATVARAQFSRPIHFLWVGDGYHPDEDVHYGAYLYEQIQRSGLQDVVTFLKAIPDLDPVYRIADAFFLSSRRDPGPNVAIDAMKLGIPLVCFKGASGTADLLLTNRATAGAVLDHLDANAAGQYILRLAQDCELHAEVSEAVRTIATGLSDMETYAGNLEVLGTAAEARMRQRQADAETLVESTLFEDFMFSGLEGPQRPRAHSITVYLATAESRGRLIEQVRRPCPGFHPYRYQADHPERMQNGENPLADFIRNGAPIGPWYLPVLRPDDPQEQASGYLRVALHAHFYYPELAEEFLGHLRKNKSPCDLLISTDSESKARQLRKSLACYELGVVDIRVTPNRGRDMGPLLTEFGSKLAGYDLVGHVHSKRSLLVGDSAVGERWRWFLWQHLLGWQHAMLDRIIAAFEKDEKLGLVFPSDPHLIGWNENRKPAAYLAARIGFPGELPEYFDFPLGTMFWMRRAALEPLLKLGLDWDDYPEEPVPYDGTILHAMERFMPFVCELAGYTSAVTHVLGVVW